MKCKSAFVLLSIVALIARLYVEINFNKTKPDAMMVFCSSKDTPETFYMFNAGRAIFAPFGKWEKAEEGFAYNIPSKEFEFEFTICPEYFTVK